MKKITQPHGRVKLRLGKSNESYAQIFRPLHKESRFIAPPISHEKAHFTSEQTFNTSRNLKDVFVLFMLSTLSVSHSVFAVSRVEIKFRSFL